MHDTGVRFLLSPKAIKIRYMTGGWWSSLTHLMNAPTGEIRWRKRYGEPISEVEGSQAGCHVHILEGNHHRCLLAGVTQMIEIITVMMREHQEWKTSENALWMYRTDGLTTKNHGTRSIVFADGLEPRVRDDCSCFDSSHDVSLYTCLSSSSSRKPTRKLNIYYYLYRFIQIRQLEAV